MIFLASWCCVGDGMEMKGEGVGVVGELGGVKGWEVGIVNNKRTHSVVSHTKMTMNLERNIRNRRIDTPI